MDGRHISHSFDARASDAGLGACSLARGTKSWYLILTPPSTLENSPSKASADIGNASIDYVRDGKNVDIRIAGKIDEIRVPAAGTAEAVQAACEQELNQMRQMFRELHAEIAPQLHALGTDPSIHQGQADWDETRDWHVGQDRTLTIEPSEFETDIRVGLGREDASDAAVAEQAINNEIQSREKAIRAVYAQILRDLGKSRAA